MVVKHLTLACHTKKAKHKYVLTISSSLLPTTPLSHHLTPAKTAETAPTHSHRPQTPFVADRNGHHNRNPAPVQHAHLIDNSLMSNNKVNANGKPFNNNMSKGPRGVAITCPGHYMASTAFEGDNKLDTSFNSNLPTASATHADCWFNASTDHRRLGNSNNIAASDDNNDTTKAINNDNNNSSSSSGSGETHRVDSNDHHNVVPSAYGTDSSHSSGSSSSESSNSSNGSDCNPDNLDYVWSDQSVTTSGPESPFVMAPFGIMAKPAKAFVEQVLSPNALPSTLSKAHLQLAVAATQGMACLAHTWHTCSALITSNF
jgi:hypothetical protein